MSATRLLSGGLVNGQTNQCVLWQRGALELGTGMVWLGLAWLVLVLVSTACSLGVVVWAT